MIEMAPSQDVSPYWLPDVLKDDTNIDNIFNSHAYFETNLSSTFNLVNEAIENHSLLGDDDQNPLDEDLSPKLNLVNEANENHSLLGQNPLDEALNPVVERVSEPMTSTSSILYSFGEMINSGRNVTSDLICGPHLVTSAQPIPHLTGKTIQSEENIASEFLHDPRQVTSAQLIPHLTGKNIQSEENIASEFLHDPRQVTSAQLIPHLTGKTIQSEENIASEFLHDPHQVTSAQQIFHFTGKTIQSEDPQLETSISSPSAQPMRCLTLPITDPRSVRKRTASGTVSVSKPLKTLPALSAPMKFKISMNGTRMRITSPNLVTTKTFNGTNIRSPAKRKPVTPDPASESRKKTCPEVVLRMNPGGTYSITKPFKVHNLGETLPSTSTAPPKFQFLWVSMNKKTSVSKNKVKERMETLPTSILSAYSKSNTDLFATSTTNTKIVQNTKLRPATPDGLLTHLQSKTNLNITATPSPLQLSSTISNAIAFRLVTTKSSYPNSGPGADLDNDSTRNNEDEEYGSKEFECYPPAEVTGQSPLPFIITPVNSPDNILHNKAAENVEHDYARFLCHQVPEYIESLDLVTPVISANTSVTSSAPQSEEENSRSANEDSSLDEENDSDCGTLSEEEKRVPSKSARQKVGKPPLRKRVPKQPKERKPAVRKTEPESSADKGCKRRKNGGGGGRIFSPSERQQHNTNEKTRRIQLRGDFETLRSRIPNVRDNDRASKVLILTQAKEYIIELALTDKATVAEIKTLKARQQKLHSQLFELRQEAYSMRYEAEKMRELMEEFTIDEDPFFGLI